MRWDCLPSTALTLFDCRCPIKCHWMSEGSSGTLSTSSYNSQAKLLTSS